MPWVLGVIAAFVGAALGEAGGAVLGLVLGFLVGWQGGRLTELGNRVRALEQARGPAAAARQRADAVAPPSAQQQRAPAPSSAATAEDVHAGTRESTAMPAAARVAQTSEALGTTATPTAPANAGTDTVAAAAGTPGSMTSAGHTPTPAPATAPAASPSTASSSRSTSSVDRAARDAYSHDDPGPVGRALGAVWRWFTEGNLPVKVGIGVLFIGIGAALKYAAEQGYFTLPIEVRLTAIAAAALAALLFGWRQRQARPAFGLSLQGGAIGVLLLTVFAAFRLYEVLPATAALVLVVVLVAGAAMLAVLQEAVALAVLGFLGGYLAPVLISTGSGNHVALFGYYAVLNAAVFGVAWMRDWRALNLLGFGFTFGVGTLWGARYYQPSMFPTVEPFLVLYYLFFLLIPVLHARRSDAQPALRGRGLVDGTLVFGLPLLAFPLQAALLEGQSMALAYSALALAVVYALLAWWLLPRPSSRVLGECHAALAVGFATLAVPLAFSAQQSSAVWALEGAALLWLGLRQSRRLARFAGLLLQLLAGASYLVALDAGSQWPAPDAWPLLNAHAFNLSILALSALFCSRLLERNGGLRALVWALFLGGSGWWLVLCMHEAVLLESDIGLGSAFLILLSASALLAALLRAPLAWPRLGWWCVAFCCGAVLFVPATVLEFDTPLTGFGGLAWLAWLLAVVLALPRLRAPRQRLLGAAHLAALWTFAAVLGVELWLRAADHWLLDSGWHWVLAGAPLLLMTAAWMNVPRRFGWPLAEMFPGYAQLWRGSLVLVLALYGFASLAAPGDAGPLPYIPLVNPLELLQVGIVLLLWRLVPSTNTTLRPLLAGIFALALWLFATMAALRGVHQLAGDEWNLLLPFSRLSQSALTVVWTVLGVGAWIVGSKRQRYLVWLAGAVLMGIVLLKLALVDRHLLGNLAGIVSLLTVGLLLTAVGYFAPSPPRRQPVAGAPA